MPKTRSRGSFEIAFATWHMASSGFETTITTAWARASPLLRTPPPSDRGDDCLVRLNEVVATHSRRARLAGGDDDHVDPRVSSYEFVPTMFGLVREHGSRMFMSRALPCG